jgi:hypothetical protein
MKTPYELLMGKKPSIKFMKPFGCPLTILNTADNLGKFDGKSDEGYLLGYCTNSKGFRVYNRATKKVQECLHVDFLEEQENHKGKGPDWMFDLDLMSSSMNYVPVREENQVVTTAEETQYIVHDVNLRSEDKTYDRVNDEKKSTSEPQSIDAPESTVDPQSTAPPKTTVSEENQAIQDELERMLLQETIAKAYEDNLRRTYDAAMQKAKGTDSTLPQSTVDPFESTSHVLDTSNWKNADDLHDPNMPALEDTDDELEKEGIFSDSNEDPDITNLEYNLEVSPTPTLKIHKDHPVNKIIGPSTSGVLTRTKAKNMSQQHTSLLSFICKQNRVNHKDQQVCLFACFLSQEEPKNIKQALAKESWVEAMQEELLQFKLQEVWVLCDLPDGKRLIGTKWVFRVKRDE